MRRGLLFFGVVATTVFGFVPPAHAVGGAACVLGGTISSTAGVALMELGAGSEPDLAEALERLLPRDDRYRHRHGSPGHGADHLLPVFVSPSLVIPVVGGRMTLGTWQSLVLVDLNRDNPHRRVRLSFLPG